MTSPERLRRRQYRLGIFVLLLAIFSTAQAVYFTLEDRAQRDCFESRFSAFTEGVDARGQATVLELEATRAVLLVYAKAAGVVRDDPTKPLPPKKQAELQTELVKELLEYRKDIRTVDELRASNKINPYEEGTCD